MSEVFVDAVRYQVQKTVNGGMGQVWLLTRCDAQDEPVYPLRLAVKTFSSEVEPAGVLNELDHWISLKHDHILPLLRVGRLNFQTAALMPWRIGSLGDLLGRHGTMSVAVTTQVILQVLAAIEYAADRHSLAHLDIKPANVLVRSMEPLHVEVADWGISRIASSNETAWFMPGASRKLTEFGAGTLPYMAPERLTKAWSLAPTADIYSVGMLTLEMLTGGLPFTTEDQLVEDILLGRYFERAKNMLEGFPRKLAMFCEACLNPNPKRRPQTVGRAAAVL